MSMDSVAVDVDNPIGGEMCAEGSLSSTMSFEVEEEFEAAVGQSMQDMFRSMGSNEQEPISESELSDLTKAFGACDIDVSGEISDIELKRILRMLGGSLDLKQCRDVMVATRLAYVNWCADVGKDPDEDYDYNNDSPTPAKIDAKGRSKLQVWNPFSNQFEERVSSPTFHRFHLDHVLLAPKKTTKKAKRMIKTTVNKAKSVGQRGRSSSNKNPEDEEGAAAAHRGCAERADEAPFMYFKEFVFMMNSDVLEEICGMEDWHVSARQMARLRAAYDRLEVNGDNKLSFEELGMVLMGTNPELTLTQEQIREIWDYIVDVETDENPEDDDPDTLSFIEFLEGVEALKKHEKYSFVAAKLVEPNKFSLLSLVIDTPVSQVESDVLYNKLSFLEKSGIHIMMKLTDEHMTLDKAKVVLNRVVSGQMHHHQFEKKNELDKIHHGCCLRCFAVGFVIWSLHSALENYSSMELNCYGTKSINCPAGIPSGECEATADTVWKWHVINMGSMGLFIIIEVLMLMWVAVKSTSNIAPVIDLRLVPLNQDRAFVAGALVGAAFELGAPQNPVMGVDPEAQTGFQRKLRVAVMLIFFKLKIALTCWLVKQIVITFVPMPLGAYIGHWADVLPSAGWNAFIAHSIMHEAELRAIGFITGVEVFNEIVRKYTEAAAKAKMATVGSSEKTSDGIINGGRSNITDHNPNKSRSEAAQIPDNVKVALASAVGVAIVKHGAMYAPMEMLLRHVVQFLGLEAHQAITSSGTIDNEEKFLKTVAALEPYEQMAVLETHLLTYVLDGDLNKDELEVFKHLCDITPDAVATFNVEKLQIMCLEHRENMKPLMADDLRAVLDPELQDSIVAPPGFKRQMCLHKLFEFLTA